ncbi:MAG: TIM barrel protein, partial [Candidatus Omnitrophica bacterium]|nr:TIM barrel protein [Candidatus Omnitrophota bacterium]
MNTNRRQFLKCAGAGLGAVGLVSGTTWTDKAAEARGIQSRAKSTSIHLGLVTYNLAKDWDIPAIIRNCEAAQFEGVELRTTHAHGVEVTLNQDQRAEVKKRFEDSRVELMGLGSAFDYHTPDQAKLRRDIEATKEYMRLARDVGASGVKVRPNALPSEVPKSKTLEQIGRTLRELG